MKKEMKTALKSRIKNPNISLNEKVMDDIKKLKVDDEIHVTATLKVLEVGRENDYDIPYEVVEEKYNGERPKHLFARFEVKDIKKVIK